METNRTSGAGLSRRTFIGVGGAALLSLLFLPRVAWGVGKGAWGQAGKTAKPGASFGYDAKWSYSTDRNVWLSASCHCKVGRMTELFLEIKVDAYVACGGVWKPTWSPDMPDTPTYAYIRDAKGTWLVSKYWIIDTTYDHNSYEYMVGASLRIPRRAADWTCWCGADIKGLGGSAPGTHSVAEASQKIPRYTLKDDASWKGKIVTVRPRVSPNLYLDVTKGSKAKGANVAGWSETRKTNQNWVLVKSPQGRSALVPVHLGDGSLFLDVKGGVWDDKANVQLWTRNGNPSQSFFLHSLGGGFHLVVFECSGCALDLAGGGKKDGTNFAQWNCYGNWKNQNQHMKLEEPVFAPRSAGSFKVTGEARVGGTLSPADPNETCYPYNHPGTNGMRYRYAWYRSLDPGRRGELVQGPGNAAARTAVEEDAGSYLTCVVTAYAAFGNTPYKGEVAAEAVRIAGLDACVRFFVDGEAEPCLVCETERGRPFQVPDDAWTAAGKPDCSGVDGWYLDVACERPFAEGAVVRDDVDLHARNRVELRYAQTDDSCLRRADRRYFLDEDLSEAYPLDSALPETRSFWYGDRVSFACGAPAWFEEHGRVREATCEPGAYADAAATGSPLLAARLTCNATAFLRWRTPVYDGIALS